MKFDSNKIPGGPYCYRFTGKMKKKVAKGFGDKPIEYPETKDLPLLQTHRRRRGTLLGVK